MPVLCGGGRVQRADELIGMCRSFAGKAPSVLVISPTRELAMQIAAVMEDSGSRAGLATVCVYGGVPKHTQAAALRKGVNVIVATPGRLKVGVMRLCAYVDNLAPAPGCFKLTAKRWVLEGPTTRSCKLQHASMLLAVPGPATARPPCRLALKVELEADEQPLRS